MKPRIIVEDSEDVGVYLADIGGLLPLTAEQERELGRRIALGQQARREIEQGQNREPLVALLQDGQTARQEMVQHNLKLVVSVAGEFAHRGIALADLIQEGNLALLEIAERFDYRRGWRFSTLAVRCLRRTLRRYVSGHSGAVRVPHQAARVLHHSREAYGILAQELEREPTPDETAHAAAVRSHSVARVEMAMRGPRYLSDTVGEDDDTLSDLIVDTGAESPEDAAMRSDDRRLAQWLLGFVDARSQHVLCLRNGMGPTISHHYTLREAGQVVGLTGERVREIERDALLYLRGRWDAFVCGSLGMMAIS